MQYYLFANPSFLSGIARTLDLGGHYDAYNFSVTPEEADIRELTDDWLRVYIALRASWVTLARENPEFMHELADILHSMHPNAVLPPLEPPEEADELEKATQSR